MSKTELIKRIANTTSTSQQQASQFLDAFINDVQNTVANGETVTIPGFGTFSKAHRKARDGRNPRTGEPMQIKASNCPKFKPGSNFKKIVDAA